MVKNPLIEKCLVVGIILLFVGIGIIPTIAQDIEKTSLSTSPEKNQRFDTAQVPLPPSGRWMKTFGRQGSDLGYSVQQTMDGGYVITGLGADKVWLIKIDGNGDMVWNKTFGGIFFAEGYFVQQTSDSGYIITGITFSSIDRFYDVWLIKTDGNGNMVWNRSFGGTGWDEGRSVQQTTDGGYIIVGYTDSFGAGEYDVWLIKTDGNGDMIWNRTFGGTWIENGYSVQQTRDGGYIITGEIYSSVNRSNDVWLIKTDSKI